MVKSRGESETEKVADVRRRKQNEGLNIKNNRETSYLFHTLFSLHLPLVLSKKGLINNRAFTKKMATEAKPAAIEETKVDLFEDDDEFEEFEIDQEWDDKEEGKEALQQWEDDWDDDDVNDDFSLQLRKELESKSEKSS
ncbi:hypothetical protein LUZ61_017113 [Rhynchospora tenuis]|uniref:26S proteasome complex subunit SEM1 n=1 Tax=Rhynchospora tenuis TaxID=198213 RepID=A0AAD6EKP6_9POAL|nr:hypothetical protein LUZ61_017113 [Rhynchospora tenuis]